MANQQKLLIDIILDTPNGLNYGSDLGSIKEKLYAIINVMEKNQVLNYSKISILQLYDENKVKKNIVEDFKKYCFIDESCVKGQTYLIEYLEANYIYDNTLLIILSNGKVCATQDEVNDFTNKFYKNSNVYLYFINIVSENNKEHRNENKIFNDRICSVYTRSNWMNSTDWLDNLIIKINSMINAMGSDII